MKKTLPVVLILALTFTFIPFTASAKETAADPEDTLVYDHTKTESEAEKEMDQLCQQIDAEIEELKEWNKMQRGPQYLYRTEYRSGQYKTVSGYAGNQQWPYVIYRKHSGAQYKKWDVYRVGGASVEYSCTAYAKKYK